MPRIQRKDAPGRMHHIYNRGLSQRVIFENDRDRRYFLYLLARQVRAGRIRVLAYCLMTNHFHLLIESVRGEISRAMKLVLNAYVRRFNRERSRTGPLFASRFHSKQVDSLAYWITCVAYIDRNPVDANMVDHAEDYVWGSAYHYARPSGPRWLARSKMEDLVIRGFNLSEYDPSKYSLRLTSTHLEDTDELIEARLFFERSGNDDPLDKMLWTPGYVETWFKERAQLADGGNDYSPMATRKVVMRAIDEHRHAEPNLVVHLNSRPKVAWPYLTAGLLSHAARTSTREIALELSTSQSTACDRVRAFKHLVATDPNFAQLTARIMRRCLAPLNEFVQGSQAPGGWEVA